MTDSERLDMLDAKHEWNRRQRIESVKQWVEYIRDNPPGVWGPQQNGLINSQLQSARDSGLDAEHYRRIEDAGRDQ